MRVLKGAVALLICAGLAVVGDQPVAQSQGTTVVHVTPENTASLRQWDGEIDRMFRAGDLRLRQERDDTMLEGRSHQRFDQYVNGVRIFGGDVVRQLADDQTVTVFGILNTSVDIETTPRLSVDEARGAIEDVAGHGLFPEIISGRLPSFREAIPELVVLPRESGGYTLAYRARAFTGDDLKMIFVDANSGELLMSYSDLQRQAAVGQGQGVLGDRKKLSVLQEEGQFRAADELRPPAIITLDMRGNADRFLQLFRPPGLQLSDADVGSDSDNTWTDPVVVDGHVYAGWSYDYFFKRFGRQGLDNQNFTMISFVNPVRRTAEDLIRYQSNANLLFLNAGYLGNGLIYYGVGLPPGFILTSTRQSVNHFVAGFDVASHEWAHGVTDFSSRLIYQGESGALNEAFSDVMAVGAEFFFQATGAPGASSQFNADYVVGEDVLTGPINGNRSLQNPTAFQQFPGFPDPDHYSRRYTGQEDNGGVHINSTIPGHAYYLAIEGGTNRTSGLSVQGVGGANREQIERVFYRAFTQFLTSSANFSAARAACIRAAQELYGTGGAVQNAVTQAWTAVGVQ